MMARMLVFWSRRNLARLNGDDRNGGAGTIGSAAGAGRLSGRSGALLACIASAASSMFMRVSMILALCWTFNGSPEIR
jgi:hypothetical protein